MLEIKLDNDELLKGNYGEIMTLNQFLFDCCNNIPKRSDGFIYEILLNGRVVCKEIIFADELTNGSIIKDQLDTIQKKYGSLSIVWYKNTDGSTDKINPFPALPDRQKQGDDPNE